MYKNKILIFLLNFNQKLYIIIWDWFDYTVLQLFGVKYEFL